MELTSQTALWLLPVVLPVAIYIAWHDMRDMKISNASVMALLGVFVILGPFAFGWPDYLYQLVQAPVVLVVGMALWALRLMGGGDAKMLAAMAPYIVLDDLALLLAVFVAATIAALATHSLFRFTALRNLAPDWKSWSARKGNLRGGLFGLDLAFPKGLALSMTLVFYLGLAVLG